MDFSFDEDVETYRQELGRWATKVLAPHYQSDDKAAVFRRELATAMAAMGLTGLRIPEEYDGQDASAVVAGMATEEIAKSDFNAAYVTIVIGLISDILVRNANPEQQRAWLPGIVSGETIPCICITEPGHGTDAASLELKAKPKADGWTLHGEKTSITLGMTADRAVVLARTGGPGASTTRARSSGSPASERPRPPSTRR